MNAPSSASIRLFLDYDVWFDPVRQENASLYLFGLPGSDAVMETLKAALIDADLWEKDSKKSVKDDQRQTYADLLDTVEVIQLNTNGLFAGRFDHPKFKSSATQWDKWKRVLQQL